MTWFKDSSLLSISIQYTVLYLFLFPLLYLMIPSYCFPIRAFSNQHLPFLFQRSTRLIHFLGTYHIMNPTTCLNSTFNLSTPNDCSWLVLTAPNDNFVFMLESGQFWSDLRFQQQKSGTDKMNPQSGLFKLLNVYGCDGLDTVSSYICICNRRWIFLSIFHINVGHSHPSAPEIINWP